MYPVPLISGALLGSKVSSVALTAQLPLGPGMRVGGLGGPRIGNSSGHAGHRRNLASEARLGVSHGSVSGVLTLEHPRWNLL